MGGVSRGQCDFGRLLKKRSNIIRREMVSPEGGFYTAQDAG